MDPDNAEEAMLQLEIIKLIIEFVMSKPDSQFEFIYGDGTSSKIKSNNCTLEDFINVRQIKY